jgi:hypothetical protein
MHVAAPGEAKKAFGSAMDHGAWLRLDDTQQPA